MARNRRSKLNRLFPTTAGSQTRQRRMQTPLRVILAVATVVGVGLTGRSTGIAAAAVSSSSGQAHAPVLSTAAWQAGPAFNCPSGTRLEFPTTAYNAFNTAAAPLPPGVLDTPLARQYYERALHTTFSHSEHCASNGPTPTPPVIKPATQDNSSPTNNTKWAGYEATNPNPPSSGTPFDGAYLEWTVPTITGDSNAADSAIWPGLGSGADGLHSLVQAGTDQQWSCFDAVACAAGIYGASYYFWWEVYPENGSQTISLAVHGGDDVGVFVGYDYTDGVATFGFTNYTTNQSSQIQQTLPGYDGTGQQVEWIAERPTDNGSVSRLANFGQADVQGAQADVNYSGDNYQYFVGDPHLTTTEWDMYDCSTDSPPDQLLAYPEAYDNGGDFYFQWVAYGATDSPNCS